MYLSQISKYISSAHNLTYKKGPYVMITKWTLTIVGLMITLFVTDTRAATTVIPLEICRFAITDNSRKLVTAWNKYNGLSYVGDTSNSIFLNSILTIIGECGATSILSRLTYSLFPLRAACQHAIARILDGERRCPTIIVVVCISGSGPCQS